MIHSEQYVSQLIQGSIDTIMHTNQELTPLIAHCSELLVQCLLSEHKILCCGEATNGALVQIFTSHLLNRFDYERPGLPAISLSSDATTLSALCSDNNFSEVFSKQIRALGQSGEAGRGTTRH